MQCHIDFDDIYDVFTDVFVHGSPQCVMPYFVECLFEVNEYMVQISLVLEIFFAKDS